MSTVEIRVKSVRLFPHNACLAPEFAGRPVLSPDPFAYVRLKLQRDDQNDALVYWRQAEEFFQASAMLSAAASPLTSYYCILNAVKALLTVHSQQHGAYHGLSGKHTNHRVTLKGEVVHVSSGGVFPALVALYGGSSANGAEYTLRNLLSELPFVHRSYTLT